MGGVLLVNKSADVSSHYVVKRIRNLFQTRKVGHAGTLDPFATGLLLVCLDEATKISEYLMEGEKEYVGTLKLGETTDTQDRTGQIVETHPVPEFDEAAIRQAFTPFLGTIGQVPPMFSAKKFEGMTLYSLARQGKHVERSARQVTIRELELQELALPYLRFRVVCSKGTYIRTLAHDLGEVLGCGATLHALERTRSGQFVLRDAVAFQRLLDLGRHAPEVVHVIPTDQAIPDFPVIRLNEAQTHRFVYGTPIIVAPDVFEQPAPGAEEWTRQTIFRVYGSHGQCVALAFRKPRGESRWYIQPTKVFDIPQHEENP